MTDQALYAAHVAKAREIVVASVKRLRAAHVDCTELMEQAERYLHATRAIDHFHAVYDADLAFEPNDQRTIAGLANVGSALFELLSPAIPSHTPDEALAEAINHLINMRAEARLFPAHNQMNGRAL
ncbi:hypothetical protein BBJ41_16910 [Burkholderia stabilis]|uniref:hypothetical protein n=1 Tax=Burkholderia cepacia complex TaxID=87882 RepID=UPI000668D4F1|nr:MULTISPECIES: hypothetical protein [Burkholderia cepacia complex]AOR69070.1 hypothetical protein BBJ41_16910 [Burkholderia stabilis]MBR8012200.1 hypothetical protein [Burkholderia vietnamiensis]MDN7441652.1 hypothetical protein [Burkholderia cepacia]HDR9041320.1 hypothetical protein [Burkholderia vietnamiensis]HDR9196323.1 hypothetical protein [Burkholderia vietnamiensis]